MSDTGQLCICRIFAWHPKCPVHKPSKANL